MLRNPPERKARKRYTTFYPKARNKLNKNTLNRLKELKSEVEKLPDQLLSEDDFHNYYGGKSNEEVMEIDNKLAKTFENKNKVMREIIGFFNANLDENSVYYNHLSSITFRTIGAVYNVGHYKNDEAWRSDKKSLLNLLEILENEIKETMNKKTVNSENIFKSALFWTILPIVAGVAYFLGTYKAEYDKSELEKELRITKAELKTIKDNNLKLRKENNVKIQTKSK